MPPACRRYAPDAPPAAPLQPPAAAPAPAAPRWMRQGRPHAEPRTDPRSWAGCCSCACRRQRKQRLQAWPFQAPRPRALVWPAWVPLAGARLLLARVPPAWARPLPAQALQLPARPLPPPRGLRRPAAGGACAPACQLPVVPPAPVQRVLLPRPHLAQRLPLLPPLRARWVLGLLQVAGPAAAARQLPSRPCSRCQGGTCLQGAHRAQNATRGAVDARMQKLHAARTWHQQRTHKQPSHWPTLTLCALAHASQQRCQTGCLLKTTAYASVGEWRHNDVQNCKTQDQSARACVQHQAGTLAAPALTSACTAAGRHLPQPDGWLRHLPQPSWLASSAMRAASTVAAGCWSAAGAAAGAAASSAAAREARRLRPCLLAAACSSAGKAAAGATGVWRVARRGWAASTAAAAGCSPAAAAGATGVWRVAGRGCGASAGAPACSGAAPGPAACRALRFLLAGVAVACSGAGPAAEVCRVARRPADAAGCTARAPASWSPGASSTAFSVLLPRRRLVAGAASAAASGCAAGASAGGSGGATAAALPAALLPRRPRGAGAASAAASGCTAVTVSAARPASSSRAASAAGFPRLRPQRPPAAASAAAVPVAAAGALARERPRRPPLGAGSDSGAASSSTSVAALSAGVASAGDGASAAGTGSASAPCSGLASSPAGLPQSIGSASAASASASAAASGAAADGWASTGTAPAAASAPSDVTAGMPRAPPRVPPRATRVAATIHVCASAGGGATAPLGEVLVLPPSRLPGCWEGKMAPGTIGAARPAQGDESGENKRGLEVSTKWCKRLACCRQPGTQQQQAAAGAAACRRADRQVRQTI